MFLMRRGEIYYFDLGENRGSEVNKVRPCVVIQNNVGNKYSPTTIVAPISHGKNRQPTQIALKDWMQKGQFEKLDGVVQTEQIRTVDKSRMVSSVVGMLNYKAMNLINEALLISIGISKNKRKEKYLAI